jgi:hypothetical protein
MVCAPNSESTPISVENGTSENVVPMASSL